MSRKTRSKKNRSRRYSKGSQRDYRYNTNIENVLRPLHRRILNEIEDGRRFHPKKTTRQHLSLSGQLSRTTYSNLYKWKAAVNPFRDIIRFVNPRRTIVCRRRSIRRRSLFALTKIGKGIGGSFKKRIMTKDSKISCRR